MNNKKATFNILLWNNGSVLTKEINEEDINISKLEEYFRQFIQDEINKLFENTHWDISISYPESECYYPHKNFSKNELQEALDFYKLHQK